MTTSKLFPMLLWLVYMFVATASSMRANEQELEARGFEGLLLSGASGSQMFVAKAMSGWLFLSLTFLLCSGVLALALDQSISTYVLTLAGIGVSVSLAFSSLLVLLSAVASTSRMKGVLLPLITLPLCFPLFFAGIEMTTELVLRGSVELSSPWPSVVLCADALFFVLGVNLFEYVVRD
jgi:heme exporter protein B